MLQIQCTLLATEQQEKSRLKILSPKMGSMNRKKNLMLDVYSLRKFCHFTLFIFVHMEG